MYMHPETFLWLHEQERERQATKRALERAARGGEPDDGIDRGGISLTRALGRARDAVMDLHLGGPRSASPETGPTGG
ncbi:MAG TPA: hypothetical protein VK194_03645 [Candidatus Deferrimicrobium sp.]|nr:hypothetical protein [Candidatus Deferrimicrobium sp.]